MRLTGWFWLLFVWVTLSARAQNLVTNPGFFGGEITGWQGNPGYIGYGPSPGGAWIGLNGELYQDLTTEAGAAYTVEFSVQGVDPSQWRPHSLEVTWDNQRLARFDFVNTAARWLRPRFTVWATGPVTRLHFRGVEYPSLDTVSVTRILPGFTTGSMELPLDGSKWLEGQSIPLRCLWTPLGGAVIPDTTTFLLGGITPIATGSRVGNTAEAVWTNVPAGVHFVSASTPTGYQTSPVRIEVVAQPKIREVQPANGHSFTLGKRVPLFMRLADNTGTNAVQTVRISVDGELLGRFPITTDRMETSWTGPTKASHAIVYVGESSDGRDILNASVLVHGLPPAEVDIEQSVKGAWENLDTSSPVAQTFTPGIDGRLIALEVSGWISSGEVGFPLRIDIVDADPVTLLPGTRTLGSTTRTLVEAAAESKSGKLHFTFPSNQVQLIAGKPYAMICRYLAPAGQTMYLNTSFIDAIPGLLWRRSSTGWTPAPFREGSAAQDLLMTTWMAPSPKPQVTVASPAPLAAFAAGTSIPIHVEAAPGLPTGSLVRVAFFANGLELGSLTAAPYAFTWTNPPAGNHLVQANATDSDGRVGWTVPVSVLSGIDAATMPRIRVEDTVSPEGNTSLPPLVFPVNLSAPSASPVTVRFSTRDLTAVATFDYLATSGTLTFAPGQTRAYVYVRMRADTRDESSRQLRLELSLPEGAILERPSAIGTLFDDEPGVGKPAAYQWSVPSTQINPGVPFTAQLTALDPEGTKVSSIPGGVTIRLISETGPERLFNGTAAPTQQDLWRDVTAGYRIRPKVDVLVTHLQTRGGSKVTLWTDQGRVEASAGFTRNPDAWQEVALPHPVLLKAGSFHLITAYVGPEGMPTGGNGFQGIDLIEIWKALLITGDGFPTLGGVADPLVDFRFVPIAERPDLLPPVLAAEFPQGTWEGALTLTTPGPRLRLVARDLVGNTSVSAGLRLPPPFMVLESDPAATLGTPSFLLHVPDGYLFNVQTSTNLQSWDNTGPSLRSSGSPIPWQPAGPPLPMGFFRLIAVE